MFSVINQKGGVGKTTTTMNLAHALALCGARTLVVDLDPQSHLTAGLGFMRKQHQGVAEMMLGELSMDQVMVEARENLALIPAGKKLGDLEHMNSGGARRGWLLRDALEPALTQFDYVLIDCPPSSGILGINAILASQEVLIPVSGDFFALQGVARLLAIFRHIESTLNKDSKKWVVLTRFHERRKLARDVKDKILGYFPDCVYQTAIRETVALAESPGFGQTIFEYQPKSNGANDYADLAADVIENRIMH